MKNILSFIFCFIAFGINAQNVSSSEIIGTFKVSNFEFMNDNMSPEQLEIFNQIEKDFYKSIFQIKPTGEFNLKISESSTNKFKELFFLQNKCWYYDINSAILGIGSDEDNYSQMRIEVMKNKEKIIFYIMESPIFLELTKI